MKTAKEWIFDKYPEVKEEWNLTGHDDRWMCKMMEEYAQKRTKDCYPKEFCLWTIERMENGDLCHFFSDNTFAIYDSDEDLTLDELFIYWKDKIK